VFDDLIEFISIQKEFTLNLLRHASPEKVMDQEKGQSRLIQDVLINKVLEFTINQAGVEASLDYLSSKYGLVKTNNSS